MFHYFTEKLGVADSKILYSGGKTIIYNWILYFIFSKNILKFQKNSLYIQNNVLLIQYILYDSIYMLNKYIN
jgi:hypothetical protein